MCNCALRRSLYFFPHFSTGHMMKNEVSARTIDGIKWVEHVLYEITRFESNSSMRKSLSSSCDNSFATNYYIFQLAYSAYMLYRHWCTHFGNNIDSINFVQMFKIFILKLMWMKKKSKQNDCSIKIISRIYVNQSTQAIFKSFHRTQRICINTETIRKEAISLATD